MKRFDSTAVICRAHYMRFRVNKPLQVFLVMSACVIASKIPPLLIELCLCTPITWTFLVLQLCVESGCGWDADSASLQLWQSCCQCAHYFCKSAQICHFAGNKPLPEPVLTNLCHHVTSLDHNELIFWWSVSLKSTWFWFFVMCVTACGPWGIS